jgi:hypothetical protein
LGVAGPDIVLQARKIKRDMAISSEVGTGSREENASGINRFGRISRPASG